MILKVFLVVVLARITACQESIWRKGVPPENGTITSSGFPNGYVLSGATTIYWIQNTNKRGVQVLLTDLDINPKSVLELHSADSPSSLESSWKLLVRIQGGDFDRDRVYHSDSSCVILKFTSGCCGPSNAAGFRVVYTFVSYNLESWTAKPFTRCGVLTDYGGNISLSSSMERYNSTSKNIDCIWLFRPSSNLAQLTSRNSLPTRVTSNPLRFVFSLITFRLLRHEDGQGELAIRDGTTSSSNLLLRYDLYKAQRFQTLLSSENNSAGLYIRLTAKSLVRFDFAYSAVYNLTTAAISSRAKVQDLDCPSLLPFRCTPSAQCLDERLVCDRISHCSSPSDEYSADENMTMCKNYDSSSSWPNRGSIFPSSPQGQRTTPPSNVNPVNDNQQRESPTSVGLFDSKPVIIAGCVTLTLLLCCVGMIGIVIALKRGHLKWLRSQATRMFDQNDLDHSLFATPNREVSSATSRHKRTIVQRILYLFRADQPTVVAELSAIRLQNDSETTSDLLSVRQTVDRDLDQSRSQNPSRSRAEQQDVTIDQEATDTFNPYAPIPHRGRLPNIGLGEVPRSRQPMHSRTLRASAAPSIRDGDDTTLNDDASSVCSNFTRLTPPPYSAAVRL